MRPRLKRLIMSMPVGSVLRQDVDIASGSVSADAGRKTLNASMSENELELLAQLQAANSALESDKKSVASFTGDERKQSLNESNNNKSPGSQADDISIKSSNSLRSQISSSQTDDIDGETELETAQRELVSTWSKLLDEWDIVIKKRAQYVRDLAAKGVPRELRCIVWQYLCGAHNSSNKDKYMDYLKQTSACEKVIKRDITRTYPEHEFFAEKDGLGQESLFNVMKAYSLHDREVGYCQGSCFIVGLLLMVMPEEEAFTVLCQLMSEYRLRLLYKPTMFELGVCMYQLEYLIEEQLPALYQHFQAQCFHTSMYASSWFLTLFTTQLPLDVCFRIMDMFLLDGMEVIFRVGVAILMIGESDLLCLDMEGMLTYFQDNFKSLTDEELDNLLDQTLKVKYNAKKMKKLEKEYSLLKMKENEDQVELRRLRSENRLLRQRIDNLEKENITLADRLIQGQVTLAQEAEVMFGVKRELSQLREQNKELKRSLGASEQQITQLKQSQPPRLKRSVSVPSTEVPVALDDGLNHVRDLRTALNDLRRSLTTVNDDISFQEGQVDVEKVTTLQEELIAVKLREAESNLALRELANHVTDLDKEWQKYQERTPNDKLSRSQSHTALDDLMSAKLKETQYLTTISQLKLKLTDSKTCGQTTSNKVERLLDENERLRGQASKQRDEMTTLKTEVDEYKNNIANFQSKSAEDVMASKINSVEHSALIAELRTRIAELEVKNQELSATADISPVIITPPHEVTNNEAVMRRVKSESSPLPNNDILNITRNSLSFSTLDIIKGDFNDSDNSDGDNSESGPSRHNSESSNTGPSRRLTVMQMDKDDEAFEKRTRSRSLNPNELNGSLVLS